MSLRFGCAAVMALTLGWSVTALAVPPPPDCQSVATCLNECGEEDETCHDICTDGITEEVAQAATAAATAYASCVAEATSECDLNAFCNPAPSTDCADVAGCVIACADDSECAIACQDGLDEDEKAAVAAAIADFNTCVEGEGEDCSIQASCDGTTGGEGGEGGTPLTKGDPCPEGLTVGGYCGTDGAVYWCEDGVVDTIDCPSAGLECAFVPENEWYDCVDPGGETGTWEPLYELEGPCPDGMDYEGLCGEDGAVYWCEKEVVKGIDCAGNGATCGYRDDAGFYDCISGDNPSVEPDPFTDPMTAGDPCPEGLTEVGYCATDDAAYWCDSGVVVTNDCAPLGQECGLVDQGWYDCISPEGGEGGAEECPPDMLPEGRCNGDIVEFCQGNLLVTQDCAQAGKACGYSDLTEAYECVADDTGSEADATTGTGSDAGTGTEPDTTTGTEPDTTIGTEPDATTGTESDATTGADSGEEGGAGSGSDTAGGDGGDGGDGGCSTSTSPSAPPMAFGVFALLGLLAARRRRR